jgi:predicted nucleic acid-binding protein
VNVLVDTCVWSLLLRRATTAGGPEVRELTALLAEERVVMIGPVRQELLSGVRNARQFELLRERLRAFDDLALRPEHHEEAARCFNRCRDEGIQGSNTDFLLCAVSLAHDLAIFTTDQDFVAYRKALPLRLHAPRG